MSDPEKKREYMRKYREMHREELLKRQRDFYAQHREEILVAQRKYRETHRDRRRAVERQYNEAHREQKREKDRRYHEANAEKRHEKGRLYRLAHPEKQREQQQVHGRFQAHQRRARRHGVGGTFTAGEWREMKAKCEYRCLCCGKQEPEIKLTIDHVKPISKGGRHEVANIQPLCLKCNLKKGVKETDYRGG